MSVLLETSHGFLTVDLAVKSSVCTVTAFLDSLSSQPLTEQSLVRLEKDFCAVFPFKNRLNLTSEDPQTPRFDRKGLIGLDASGIVITLTNRIQSFDRKFRLLGCIAEDSELTLQEIQNVIVDGEGRPLVKGEAPTIRAVFILADPLQVVGGLAAFNRRAVTERINQERVTQQQKEAKKRHTGTKQTEKTLFIARLNKLTEEADLKVIFNKFGTVRRLNIVKDEETGESLGYGFVEFTDKQTCDKTFAEIASRNLEIDDRKIFVDFAHGVR